MKTKCPHCDGHYEVDLQHVGKTLKCPDCGNDFGISNANLSPCPDCFSNISKRAQTCPHCGAPLALHASGRHVSSAASADIASEKEIMICRPCAMNYISAVILGILTIPLLFGIFILLYVWIEIRYTSYRITTLRIVVRRGWIAKIQNEIWIRDMRAANLSQSIWQRLIGTGNIAIGTAATAGTEICMVGIASPQQVVDKINALRS